MKTKRLFAVLMSVCMLGAIALNGCGSSDASTSADEGTGANAAEIGSEEQAASGEKGYVFEANGVKVAVDMDMAPIAEALGEPDSYFEEPSCAAQGIAKLYTYSSFEIETYPDGDNDLVACVILKDDNVATAEGVDLSMTKADVIEVYGEDYEETEGCIAYRKDGMKLCFILDGENIASIEYNSSVLD